LAGQRRFLAVMKLGWTTIPAYIIEKPKDDIKAKALSFSENIMRKSMIDLDLVDACVYFYHKYGTMAAAAKELGLPYEVVRKHIKFDQIPEALKEKIDKGNITMPVALKALDAATLPDNTVDEAKAVSLATEMAKMDTIMQKELIKEAKMNPTASVDVLTEEVKKPITKKPLTIVMQLPTYQSLKKFSEAEKLSSPEEAAVDLIIDGLTSKGY
jgi:ParB-like chromosome segregation protein Spo0J